MAILSCYENRSAAVLIQAEKTNFNLLLTSRPLNSKLSIWSLTTMKWLCIQSSWKFLTTYFHKGIYICARIDELFCNIHMASLARNKQWGSAVLGRRGLSLTDVFKFEKVFWFFIRKKRLSLFGPFWDCNKVSPNQQLTTDAQSTIAPAFKRILAMSTYPPCAAKNKAVVPVCQM